MQNECRKVAIMGHCLQVFKHGSDTAQRIQTVQYHPIETFQEMHIPPIQVIRGPPAPKQRFFHPVSLQKLASETLRDYVHNFALHLIQLLGKNSKQFQDAVKDCSSLQNMLHFNVPASFANDITDKFLVSVDNIYKDVQIWKKESWFNNILLELVRAIIHPAITKLNLHCSLCLLSNSLFRRLNTLINLRELRLYHLRDQAFEPLIIEALCNMKYLEMFTVHYHCSDSIMTAVGNKCKYIKNLDVAFSRSVTDLSIGPILKLVCLDEINLMDTSVSEDGYMKLLIGIKDNKVKDILQMFGCSEIKTCHFNILFWDFPKLVEVDVKRYSSSGNVTKGLNTLQIIRFFDCRFSDMQELLIQAGNCLIELELDKIKDLNIKVIGESCHCLRKLTINGYVRHIPQYENSNVVLPGFKSLEDISLNLYRDYSFIAYLLSECRNLKKVDLFITDGSEQETDMTIEFVLSRNPLINLQGFSIKTHMAGLLTKKTIMLLINQCPNIKELHGVNTWSSIGILEDFVEEMADLYPQIHLTE